MDTKNTITFKIGEETRPVLETENLKNSIFAELYQKAFVEINKYVEKVQSIKDSYTYEGINNIFAFIGERGAGKTSCMMSVAKALENNNEVTYKSLGLTDSPKNKVPLLQKNTFTNSVLIDPSFFDQKNNILSLIIAHLFKKFRDEASKSSCKHDIELKREVIECFEKVQKNLKHFLSDDKSGNSDSLDTLVNFAATVDLQKDIKQLVEKYLKFISSNQVKDSANFLVLMIDDIDLHTKHAREMVEQIRKYFIQPNIIVLIAVKIDQLSNVIKNELGQEYKLLIDKNEMSFDLINEMVERYIGKLIPHAQRFYLPDASVYFNSKLKITSDKHTKIDSNNELIYTDIAYSDGDLPELRERVLSLIYKKTRYLFYNTKEATNYIIPRNLRELRQIIALLLSMNSNSISFNNNQTIFRKYFIGSWSHNNLSVKALNHINELFNITDAVLINKRVISILKDYFKHIIGTDNAEVNLINNIENKTYNISLGDVIFVLNYLLSICFTEEDIKFIYAIKTFYSIKLNEYKQKLVEAEVINPLIVNDGISSFSDFEKLIAGAFINTDRINLIPKKKISVGGNLKEISKNQNTELITKYKLHTEDYINEELSAEEWADKIIEENGSKSIKDSTAKNSLINALIQATISHPEIDFITNLHKELPPSEDDNKFIHDAFKHIVSKGQLKEYSISRTRVNLKLKSSLSLLEDKTINLQNKELIMLLISRRPDTQNDELNYRRKDEVRFNSSLDGSNQKNVYLDIYSIFFNLLNYERAIKRFSNGDLLLKEILLNDKSFICHLMNIIEREYKADSKISEFIKIKNIINSYNASKTEDNFNALNRLLKSTEQMAYDKTKSVDMTVFYDILIKKFSCLISTIAHYVAIDNIEVLEQITEYIISQKIRKGSQETETDIYEKYFERLSSLSLNKYKPNTYNLQYLSICCDILKEQDIFEIILPKQITENDFMSFYLS